MGRGKITLKTILILVSERILTILFKTLYIKKNNYIQLRFSNTFFKQEIPIVRNSVTFENSWLFFGIE